MYITSSMAVAALASMAYAQTTPKGFTPIANMKLELFFNQTMVMTPGQQLSKATTASPPQLAVSTAMGNMSATYMFVMLDLDVPPQKGGSTRRVLLHAMNTDFRPTKQKISGAAMLLASDSKGPAPYLPPGPPATDTVAHRYVQLLFQQPTNLKVNASDFANTTARFDFDINKFMSQNGLSAPMAGNFFKVDGRANATEAAGGSATESGGRSRSSAKPFEGTAAGLDVSHGLAGLLGGLVLLAI